MKRKVAITGASGGIGSALARYYANKDTQLYLCARDALRLERIANACRQLGAEVHTQVFDLRDYDLMISWVDELTADGFLSIFISTSGVSASVVLKDHKREPEAFADLQRELDVNSTASILCVNQVVEKSLQQKSPTQHLQVGVISSLAALTGLPSSPGYSASKASLRVYCQALRRLVKHDNIGVTAILPGYIDTAMSQRYIGVKPWMISAEEAAEKIAQSLQKNQPECIFPKILAFGIFLLNCLPEFLQAPFLKNFDFQVLADQESQRQKSK